MLRLPSDIMDLLYKDVLEQPLTQAERSRLDEWKANPYRKEPLEIDIDDPETQELYQLLKYFEGKNVQKWEQFADQLKASRPVAPTIVKKNRRAVPLVVKLLPYAAAAAAVIFAVVIIRHFDKPGTSTDQIDPVVAFMSFKPVIPSGINKAILTLPDGLKIALSKAASIPDSTVRIEKISDEEMIIEQELAIPLQPEELPGNADNSGLPAGLSYASVTTSNGCKYKIDLPDGSKVWLNASSSLRFPTTFGRTKRIVAIAGEAYFEIAKDAARPFIVVAGNTKTEVLGTHFNVMAYDNEPTIGISLLEGQIKISRGTEVKIMVPGQITYAGAGELRTEKADVTSHTTWVTNIFCFKGNSIEEVMRKIGRWYGVEVEFRGKLQPRSFVGKFPMNTPLPTLLQKLEYTKEVHFQMTGKKIVVMKYSGS